MSEQQPWATAHYGKVAAVKRWSDTHVSSYGGGGYVDPHFGGRVSPPTIASSIVQRTEVFSVNSEGRESSFEFSNLNVPIREGSNILVSWGSEYGASTGPYLYVENLDTGERFVPAQPTIELQGTFWSVVWRLIWQPTLIFSVLFSAIFVASTYKNEFATFATLLTSTDLPNLTLPWAQQVVPEKLWRAVIHKPEEMAVIVLLFTSAVVSIHYPLRSSVRLYLQIALHKSYYESIVKAAKQKGVTITSPDLMCMRICRDETVPS